MEKISQKIIDYAIWYYLKYYPSVNKLKFKLKFKFWPESEKGLKYWWVSDEEIDFIINEKLRNIIQEEEVIESKIRNYINKGKSKLYIRQKMFERQENKEIVEEKLNKAFENWEWEIIKKEYEKLKNRYNREKIIEKLIRKWFFYNEILQVID